MRSEQDLKDAIAASHDRPVAVFKHSTRCGISAFALNNLNAEWDSDDDGIDFWYLDLLSYRPISNLIAETSGVWHQSPQLILFIDGKAVYNASHSAISMESVRKKVPSS